MCMLIFLPSTGHNRSWNWNFLNQRSLWGNAIFSVCLSWVKNEGQGTEEGVFWQLQARVDILQQWVDFVLFLCCYKRQGFSVYSCLSWNFLYLFIYLFICLCVSVCEFVYMRVGAWGHQKKVSGPLLLESQAVVSYTMWVPSANNKYSELLSLLSSLRFDFFFKDGL